MRLVIAAIAVVYASREEPVIVVGAGMSGLAAALELAKKGFCDVTVVEARDRPGGRTFTDTSLGEPVDLGASWIHGIGKSPVYQTCKDAGITTASFDWDDSNFFDEKGNPVSASKNNAIEADYWKLVDAVEVYADRFDNDFPLSDAIEHVRARTSFSYPQYLDFSVKQNIVEEYAGSPEVLSAWWWDMGAELTGGEAVIPGGYTQLVAYLVRQAKSLGVKFVYNKEVVNIQYSSTGSIVSFATGPEMTVRRVVATFPIGVMKAKASSLFSPILPSAKRTALNRLCVGTLNKGLQRGVLHDDDDGDDGVWGVHL